MHVLLEPGDVDDAVVRARSGESARRDPGVPERYGATNFDFYDLTAIVKRKWIIEFTNMILERKMEFTWQLPSGTRSEAIDTEVSELLYKSGCRNMSYAPESGSPAVLKRIKKVVELDRLEASVIGAVRAGLNVKLNIIMGFPNESRQELGQTVRFLARMGAAGVHDMSISLFSPYPDRSSTTSFARRDGFPSCPTSTSSGSAPTRISPSPFRIRTA